MKLLIVESPSKAKTINQYLGKEFDVISSYGHIRGLPSENGSVDPDKNFAMRYEVFEKSNRRVEDIIKKVKKCDEIYLATDPDREGEAISWHIIEALKEKKSLDKNLPIKRVVFYEITKRAVKEAIEKPREININLVHAQQARQALDYLVGFTLSPILWRKLPGSRSAGRVQSVALRIVCEREAEIEQFRTQEYWSIVGTFLNIKQKFLATLTHFNGNKLGKFDISNEVQANAIKNSVLSSEYFVEKIESKKVNRSPAPPFTTSTMLQEASRKFGFSAKKTSRLAQDLYEGISVEGSTVGLITYMRTDSVTISQEALQAARTQINKDFGEKFLPSSPRYYKTKTKNAQEAHEAIRPTHVEYTPERIKKFLDTDHYKLYDLIWKRLVASQMENAVLNTVAIDITSKEKHATFRATGSTLVFEGFLKVYHEVDEDAEEEDKQKLPTFKEGEHVNLKDVEPRQHFTQPPPRYTEASLVKKMEELGIGRPSTYPTIISILQDRDYVRVDKKRFFPEAKGRLVNAFLTSFFDTYFKYDFTAKMEDQLDHISNGEDDWKKVLKQFWEPFHHNTDEVLKIKTSEVIEKVQNILDSYIFNNLEKDTDGNHICPSCKKGILSLRLGKFGAFVGCSTYPECKYIHKPGVDEPEPDGTSDLSSTSSEQNQFPRVIGNEDGFEISIRKGPYGIYVQKSKDKEIKRASLPKGVDVSKIDISYALKLLSLPRILGQHPDGGDVRAGFGRFGPYLEHNKKFHSIKEYNPVEIDLETALKILNEPKPTKKSPPRGRKKK